MTPVEAIVHAQGIYRLRLAYCRKCECHLILVNEGATCEACNTPVPFLLREFLPRDKVAA